MRDDHRITVVYIGGPTRSGSTLLDRMLGQFRGVFSLGEMYYVWEKGIRRNELCGCGVPFKSCNFWQAVFQEAFGGMDQLNVEEIIQLRDSVQRRLRIPLLAFSSLRSERFRKQLEAYSEIVTRLYRSVSKVSGNTMLIDSSKKDYYGFFLNTLSDIKLYLVHLVRDSRAVAYSWKREKSAPQVNGNGAALPKIGVLRATRGWLLLNLLTHLLGPFVAQRRLLRYEDLVSNPVREMQSLVEWLRIETPRVDEIIRGNIINLERNHTVSGNPMRFTCGTVEIRPDVEWKLKFSKLESLTVLTLTWPLLMYHGYLSPVKRQRSGGSAVELSGKVDRK